MRSLALAIRPVIENRTLRWVAALSLLAAIPIWQSVSDKRREIAEKARVQQEQQQAEKKAATVRAKLDSDVKALSAACQGPWEEACVRPLAEAGNAAAQLEIAATSQARSDYASAIEWYERAANQSEPKAMYSLALLYSVGDTHKLVEGRYDPVVDPKKAIYWYSRAADLHDVDAMRELGGIYEEGKLTPQDYGEARKWLQRAAEAGDRSSLLTLGAMARNGEGTGRDLIEAYKWFSLACASYGGHGAELGCSERDDIAGHLNSTDVQMAQGRSSVWQKQFGK